MASTTRVPDVPTSPETSSVSPLTIEIKSPPPSPTKGKMQPTPSVADILALDGSVDVRLLMISMWKHRSNAPFTVELCQRLCSMPITQPMLDQVEFYLPQLAHMVVHLEQELPMEDMEQFVLLLSQSSVHFALQFFWMIYAALDEHRPKRTGNNPRTFARCARLLLALEQCFVYGSPAARQASELLTRQSISRDEMEQILLADRRFFAAQQSSKDTTNTGDGENVAPISGGWLLKKGGGTRTMGRRNWSMRWCRLEKRILLVFSKPTDSQPRAAIPLHGAKVHVVENKRPYYFEITHDFSDTKAKFAAKSADELSTWVAYIQKNATLPEPPAGSPTKSNSSPDRTLARMSFAMRTFIMQSSSNVHSTVTLAVDGAALPSRSESPSKTDSASRPAEVTADAVASSIGQMRTRMLSSGVSACSTQGGDTEVSQFSTTDCCGSDALMQALMLPDQQRRYEFFCGMIHFVKSITDVSESLRRVEPSKRKELLRPLLKQLRIPSRAYIPLCKATDPYCNVVSVFSDEGRVFNTHERAPCLIYFGTEETENGEDVSTVLFSELYETRTNDGGDIEEGEEAVAVFDEHAADIALRKMRVAPVSQAKQLSRCMSPFLSELLSDDDRKQRLEKTFGELTFTKAERLQESVTCENPQRWRLTALMSKSYDDLRQEVLVMQLISYFQHIFEVEKLPLRLHPYRILSTGSSTGLIEVVRNAMSLDGIKKIPGFKNLLSHFEEIYGGATKNAEGDDNSGEGSELLRQAKLNFIHSLAAYSIVCYILAIKDRHNGNIMLDIEGYIIHIDFGFFLGRAPGGSFSFETAPFKLTAEMVDVLGGRHSSNFQYFTDLCVQGALAARKHADTIYTLVEVMSYHSKLPCFIGGATSPLSGLKDRLFLNIPEKKVASTIQSMVQRSYDHFGTNKYDQFQTFSNGIAK
ncbi:Phosphatidylinositol 3 and 4-Kinase-like protein [Phytophthora palmivora]|uniref:1-phosphatidylinositol 4-kinase n=1 Tax=Phytophthora palmivora TaxID=4796 RepID=A0A2P4XAJ1_9STRA|nr:Phosphatidylinositol 3 and 4-Kinase-like protein [Phytophthora palmivora]